MFSDNEKKTSDEVFDTIISNNKAKCQVRDNIFSANHRNQMIQAYGFTEAMRIKIQDLI